MKLQVQIKHLWIVKKTCMAVFSGSVSPKLYYQDDSPYYDFVYHRNNFEAVKVQILHSVPLICV